MPNQNDPSAKNSPPAQPGIPTQADPSTKTSQPPQSDQPGPAASSAEPGISTHTARSPQGALIPEPRQKIFYIEYLKVLLIVLVVMHHTFITYGASGGWYYTQKTTLIGALFPMTMFVAINQSFFMGFFFFLSAYFIRSSYERKGRGRFVTDRLLRLGVPLIFYSFILSPVLSYLVYYFADQHHITYFRYLSGFHPWIDFGVLWFAAALLLFTLIYVFIISLSNPRPASPNLLPPPSAAKIVLFAISLGLISFFVRIVFPVGWVLKPLGFQLGHFTQYIALFAAGLAAYRNNWLDTLPYRTGKRLGLLAIVLILLFPALYVLVVVFHTPVEWFSGGFHWQQLMYAVYEQTLCFSIIPALLVTGKKYFNRSSARLGKLSRNTFAVYIFHPLVLISLSMAVRNWNIEPAVKCLVIAPLAVAGSFLLASVITRIPGVRKII